MTRIGVISDTHGLIRPEALDALRGVDRILHAGDIGRLEVLERLRELAPVSAVRGNVDREDWALTLPLTTLVEAEESTLYLLHDVGALDLDPRAAGIGAVVAGHSHRPAHEVRDGVLFFNPGSAGPRRFGLDPSVGLLEVSGRSVEASIVPLR
jgi:uncharacterized protein